MSARSSTTGRLRRASARKRSAASAAKRWSHRVKTVSTFPPEGLYTKDAETIARVMATRRVSPKGLGSAIRMVQFFINRAGKSLPAARRRELERAKRLLQDKNSAGSARKPRPRSHEEKGTYSRSRSRISAGRGGSGRSLYRDRSRSHRAS